MGNKFESRFGMGDPVVVERTGESGIVTGVAFYKRQLRPLFHLQYTAADGRSTDGWFHDDELVDGEA